MRKSIDFKRMVLRNLLVGYGVILLVLAAYISYVTFGYSKSIHSAANVAADVYLNKLSDQMEQIEEQVTSWYVQENRGILLERSKNSLIKYDMAYELYQLFVEEIGRNKDMETAMVFYDDLGETRYAAQSDFNDPKIRAIKESVYALRNDEKLLSFWNVVSFKDETYLVYQFGRNGVRICVVLNYDTLLGIKTSNEENSTQIIFTGQNVVYNNRELADEIGLPQGYMEGRERFYREGYYIFRYPILENEFYFYLLLPYISSSMESAAVSVTVLIAAITLISGILTYIMFKRTMILPLKGMTRSLERIGQGATDERMEEDAQLKEYHEFGSTFNNMMDQIKNLKIQAYEERIDREKTRLQLLQLQIKPHFYLNSLTTLFALSQQKHYEKLEENILTMSDYLRFSFKDGFALVTLEEELKFAEDTVRIRKDSYNQGIEIYKDVDPTLMGEKILPLTIQTFVENSIKYAMPGNGTETLVIHIHVSKLGEEYLDVVVSDNGQGYPQEWLELMESDKVSEEYEKHIGIFNLKRRLQLEYGEDVEFVLRNSNGAVSEIIYKRKEVKA